MRDQRCPASGRTLMISGLRVVPCLAALEALLHLEDAYLGTGLGKRRAAADWSQHEVSVPMKQYDVKTVVISMKVPLD
jgi:hypothetical protein